MKFDAVVVGGGPAGAVTSLRLAEAGWHVAVVERATFPRRKVCGEFLSATNWGFLSQLGIMNSLEAMSGPEIRRVALFSRSRNPIKADLPFLTNGQSFGWGRALTRDCLDTLLLKEAASRGAVVIQPARCVGIASDQGEWCCDVVDESQQIAPQTLRTRIVIVASGSWSPATSPVDPSRPSSRRADLFGFKAHFSATSLPEELMPLLTFPGGYGGMVTCQDHLVSLSCCVRRDLLEQLRQDSGATAGDRVLKHIERSIPVVRDVLSKGSREGRWLSAGPIRPGFRCLYADGIFRVGNAAGEAHPVVAEGISMAMQSGWLAAKSLLQANQGRPIVEASHIHSAGKNYGTLWKRGFATRIRASAMIAMWAMRPTAVRVTQPMIRCFPSLLTIAAQFAGKSRIVCYQERP